MKKQHGEDFRNSFSMNFLGCTTVKRVTVCFAMTVFVLTTDI